MKPYSCKLLFSLVFSLFNLDFSYANPHGQTKPPNIVFILTDDQDVVLEGLSPLLKTKKLIGEQGMTFTNMFVNTPLCCPSRASILTGQHLHNTGVQNNSISGNCCSQRWQQETEPLHTFPPLVKAAGYRTFYAGKYMNQYGFPVAGGVKHVPRGWDVWNGLVGNSIYYDYVLSVNGVAEKHGHNYTEDYLTDLILRRALQFLDDGAQIPSGEDPFFLMLSTPSAHGPFTPAPQYENDFSDLKAPRTRSFNTHAADKHWLIRQAPNPMSQLAIDFSDNAFRNRLRTLRSVDDLVEGVVNKLSSRGLLNNTYIIFTSDNGFHMGQFSLPWDKRHLYEFDIRVPLMVRGPGIQPSSVTQYPAMNIDLAPTFLDLIGIPPVDSMDGRSLRPILLAKSSVDIDQDNGQDNGQGDIGQVNDDLYIDQWRGHMLIEHVGEYNLREQFCPKKSNQFVANCFPDCICQDSLNNTYSCIRDLHTGNPRRNHMYCEFQDRENFREFYDLDLDPDQMLNTYNTTSPALLDSLHHLLVQMKKCAGEQCRQLESANSDYQILSLLVPKNSANRL